MPPKSKFKKNKGSKSGGYGFKSICRVTGRTDAYKMSQTTSGLGCITTNLTSVSVTAGLNILLTPYSIGSRLALLAAEFAQWRVRRFTIRYKSDTTASGVVNSVSGPTTTPSYGSRPFVMCWGKDSDILPSTHATMVEMGGVQTNTSRNTTLRLPGSAWLWTSTVSAYSTGNPIDNRTVSHGTFNAAFVDASTTAAATYGRFEFTYDVLFRFPQNSSVIGTAHPHYSLTNPNYNSFIGPSPNPSASSTMKDHEDEKSRELTSSALNDSFMLVRKPKK